MSAKGGGNVGNGLGEGRAAPQPFRDFENIAGESAGVATAGFVMSSENGEGRAGVVVVWASPHKAGAVPAELHATGGEVFGQAVAEGFQ